MTWTWTHTFTVAEVSSRVMADLRQLQLFYGQPSDSEIRAFGAELDVLLPGKYVESIEYGFARWGQRVVSLLYVARYDGTLIAADNAGAVYSGANVQGANWFSFLTFSNAWASESPRVRVGIEQRLPFRRVEGTEPGDGGGSWVVDKTYGSAGMGLVRRSYRP
jgi:hypothetical protein